MFRHSLIAASIFFASSISLAYEVSDISLGGKFEDVNSKLPYGITNSSHDYYDLKTKYGFMEYMSYSNTGHFVRLSTKPDGEIYKVVYHQDFPVEQLNSIKESVCQKYQFKPEKCVWYKNYDDFDSNQLGTLFDQSQRTNSEQVRVSFEKVTTPEGTIKHGYVGLKITLSSRHGGEYKKWDQDVKQTKKDLEVAKSKQASKDHYVDPKF